MRLGGPVFDADSPEMWVAAHKKAGYSAAYWPRVSEDMVDAYIEAAREADIVIAEVGAWSNPLSPDKAQREKAVQYCKESLALADRVGARCCVNIAGSLGDKWDGPSPLDLTDDAFEKIVETTREIIDAVNPTRTVYALETMPWMYPDSSDSYLKLIKAIDREGFAVHLDPVNLINSPKRYFRNADIINDAFDKLGPYIRSCHAKDILLSQQMMVHLDEVVPGTGGLAYDVYLKRLSELDPDTPLMLEHMKKDEYPVAAAYIRSVADKIGVAFR